MNLKKKILLTKLEAVTTSAEKWESTHDFDTDDAMSFFLCTNKF